MTVHHIAVDLLAARLSNVVIGFVGTAAETLEGPLEIPHTRQDDDREHRQRQGLAQPTDPNRAAYCREHPDHRGRGHAGDCSAPRQDHACAEEPDARHDLTEHARWVPTISRQSHAESDEDLRTEANEDARSDSDGLASELPLQTDNATTGRQSLLPAVRTLAPRATREADGRRGWFTAFDLSRDSVIEGEIAWPRQHDAIPPELHHPAPGQ